MYVDNQLRDQISQELGSIGKTNYIVTIRNACNV